MCAPAPRQRLWTSRRGQWCAPVVVLTWDVRSIWRRTPTLRWLPAVPLDRLLPLRTQQADAHKTSAPTTTPPLLLLLPSHTVTSYAACHGKTPYSAPFLPGATDVLGGHRKLPTPHTHACAVGGWRTPHAPPCLTATHLPPPCLPLPSFRLSRSQHALSCLFATTNYLYLCRAGTSAGFPQLLPSRLRFHTVLFACLPAPPPYTARHARCFAAHSPAPPVELGCLDRQMTRV